MKLHKESHLDHNLSQAQVDHLVARFADRSAFFVETVTLPEELGTVPCALHFDVPESEVRYEKRGGRTWESRLCARAPRQVREVTVVAGPHDGEACIVFTMYGGPAAPQEPGDPGCRRNGDASLLFWSTAALSA